LPTVVDAHSDPAVMQVKARELANESECIVGVIARLDAKVRALTFVGRAVTRFRMAISDEKRRP
jgi:hypothetical protein